MNLPPTPLVQHHKFPHCLDILQLVLLSPEDIMRTKDKYLFHKDNSHNYNNITVY